MGVMEMIEICGYIFNLQIAAIVSSYGGRFSLYADFTIFEAHMEKLLSERGTRKRIG